MRWLLVVIGCAILAMAQPMSAAPSEDATDTRAADTVIYPKKTAADQAQPVQPKKDERGGSWLLVVALFLAAGGAWVLLQRRKSGLLAGRAQRKLQIDETRPLGNRQYLVVADYDGAKFLLGVAPGRIQMLTPLNSKAGEEKKS